MDGMTRRLAPSGIVPMLLAFGVAAFAATDLDQFGRCLGQTRATFYTADWCAACRAQERMLGPAMQYVDSVDCTAGADLQACNADGVTSFPTWEFGDGSRRAGVASLTELSHRTGCEIPGGVNRPRGPRREAPARAASPSRSNDRIEGGARIIEIPSR